MSVLKHYNLAEGHFAHTNGYQAYAAVADLIREAGLEESARAYADAQTWGTPEQIVEKVRRKREIIGDYHLNCAFSYAGLPFDKVEASMRLFAEQVIPELRRLDAVVPAQATA